MKYLFTLASIILLQCLSVQAQEAELMSPEAFLGYSLGSKFSYHHQVVDYFEYVAAGSERVSLQPYGESYEGRPLLLAFIGTEANLARLEEIRLDNLRRAGMEDGSPKLPDAPVIIWLSYNVHGNEAVSTETSMAVLHALASASEPEIEAWLEQVIVIIDPAVNPDGRDRYANWYNQVGNRWPNINPDSREHHEPWPGGRPNHYLFDLNRDWAWQTQAESQQRMQVYNQWLPHIHADFHEQGINSPYFFAPAAEPYHTYITDWQRAFQTSIGKNNSRYFDENNWLYFTREYFDLFYPSYGDTYPTFNGAIGMTYEQGGSGRAGLAVRTASEDTLTLRDRIAHHYTVSLATIEVSARNSEQVKNNFQRFFRQSAANPPGKYASYLIPQSANSTDQLKNLRNFLDKHQIRYRQANRAGTYKGWSYHDAASTSFRSQPGDLVISAHQPKAILTQVLFEPESQLSDSITYDLTAWAVPYMMGLQAYASEERIATQPYQPGDTTFVPELNIEKPYAYLQEWKSLNDAQFLASLLRAGVKVRFAEKAFVSEGRAYDPGTLILLRADNLRLGEQFDFFVREAAREWERPLQAASSGFVSEGNDFGSGSVHYLKAPRVAILSGEGVSSLGFGELWHYFEQQLQYPVSILGTGYLDQVDWGQYDVLILPNGRYGEALKKDTYARLMEWVQNGGRLILLQNALSSFADKDETGLKKKEEKEESNPMQAYLRTYGQREREEISDYNTGAIYRIHLDATHPLAFGYGNTYYSMKTDSDAYQYLKSGWNVGTIRQADDRIAGFVGKNVQEALTETLVFGVEPKGRGSLVYMTDNPLFRAFWEGGKLMFANAVFFVGQD